MAVTGTATTPTDRPAPRKVRRGGRFLGTVAAVFAGCCAFAVALPHDPYIRYQSFEGTIFDRLGWVYDRLHHDPTPIDVLFIGSSRTARGADAAAIEAALADLGRPGLHVANISLPAAGLDIRLTTLREALRAHPEIRLVVLGMVEALPRDGHQAFGDLATAGEVLGAPWIVNRRLPGHLAGLPYRQMELALASRVPAAFGHRAAFDPAAYIGPTPDHRRFNIAGWGAFTDTPPDTSAEHAEAMARESRMRRRQITPPVLPAALSDIEFGVSRTYLRRIARLLEAEGIDLAFSFLPFYGGYAEPLDAGWLAGVAPVWSADFLMDDPVNYTDAAHASGQGIDLLAPWFARQIDATLEDAP
jgi:hypothetical protein